MREPGPPQAVAVELASGDGDSTPAQDAAVAEALRTLDGSEDTPGGGGRKESG